MASTFVPRSDVRKYKNPRGIPMDGAPTATPEMPPMAGQVRLGNVAPAPVNSQAPRALGSYPMRLPASVMAGTAMQGSPIPKTPAPVPEVEAIKNSYATASGIPDTGQPPVFGQGRPDTRAPLASRVAMPQGFNPNDPSAYYGFMQVGPRGGGDVPRTAQVAGFTGNYTPQQERQYQQSMALRGQPVAPGAGKPGGRSYLDPNVDANITALQERLKRASANYADTMDDRWLAEMDAVQTELDSYMGETTGLPEVSVPKPQGVTGAAAEGEEPNQPGRLGRFFDAVGSYFGGGEPSAPQSMTTTPPSPEAGSPQVPDELQGTLFGDQSPVGGTPGYDDEQGWGWQMPDGSFVRVGDSETAPNSVLGPPPPEAPVSRETQAARRMIGDTESDYQFGPMPLTRGIQRFSMLPARMAEGLPTGRISSPKRQGQVSDYRRKKRFEKTYKNEKKRAGL